MALYPLNLQSCLLLVELLELPYYFPLKVGSAFLHLLLLPPYQTFKSRVLTSSCVALKLGLLLLVKPFFF